MTAWACWLIRRVLPSSRHALLCMVLLLPTKGPRAAGGLCALQVMAGGSPVSLKRGVGERLLAACGGPGALLSEQQQAVPGPSPSSRPPVLPAQDDRLAGSGTDVAGELPSFAPWGWAMAWALSRGAVPCLSLPAVRKALGHQGCWPRRNPLPCGQAGNLGHGGLWHRGLLQRHMPGVPHKQAKHRAPACR